MIEIFGMNPSSFLIACVLAGVGIGVWSFVIHMFLAVRKDEKRKKNLGGVLEG